MEIKVGNWVGFLEIQERGEIYRVKTHRIPQVKKTVIKGLKDCKWKGGTPPNWDRSKMYYEAPVCSRNKFHLDYFNNRTPNPYDLYKKELTSFGLEPRYSKRLGKIVDPFPHQVQMADHWWTRKMCHIAAEMRTGKTLPVLSVAERLQTYTWIIAPRTAVAGIKLELLNWDIQLDPTIMTYHEMVSILKKGELTPPKVIIFDESHMLKNWNTDRTQAAFHVTEEMRKVYSEPWIVAMTGTPAPKNPVDIWSQTEVVCPGFITESSMSELDNRLSIIEYKDNETGGQYPNRLCWRDHEGLCSVCDQEESTHHHFRSYGGINVPEQEGLVCSICYKLESEHHDFIEGKNEIKLFSERMKGFSILFLKNECMNLPEKEMVKIHVKPSRQVLKYSGVIRRSGKPAAVILNDLLQLSSGFYYEMVDDETRWVNCPRCLGKKLVENENGDIVAPCTTCMKDGLSKGVVRPQVRKTIQLDCPKDQVFLSELEECEDSMRFVAFGGFAGCIDRMVGLAVDKGWQVIRIDGRGFKYYNTEFKNDVDALDKFGSVGYKEKLAIIAHPATGGTGISMSASPTIFYWNNPFDGAARMQSIERGSDANMNMSKGCKIVDVVHLKVDQYVLDNLNKKERLQEITLGELADD